MPRHFRFCPAKRFLHGVRHARQGRGFSEERLDRERHTPGVAHPREQASATQRVAAREKEVVGRVEVLPPQDLAP